MLHAMMLEATDGRRFFAPISDHPLKILDLGTGTGTWAIDVAEMYPSANVLGIGMLLPSIDSSASCLVARYDTLAKSRRQT